MTSSDRPLFMGIDFETYSSVDLDQGVYAYSRSPDFDIMLVSYCKPESEEVLTFMPRRFAQRPGVIVSDRKLLIDDTPVFDGLDGDEDEFLALVADDGIIKTAYNANFERTCCRSYYGLDCDPRRWLCTAVLAATLGLPPSLGMVARVLGLPEDEQKLKTGKSLIQYFSKPCAPTSKNGGRTRNMPRDDPAKWQLYLDYNKQDVVAEQSILKSLMAFRPNAKEQRLWTVDQIINDRGVRFDRKYAEGIVAHDEERSQELIEEARELTGLSNPNSPAQLKKWLAGHGCSELTDSLSKDAVAGALSREIEDPDVRRMLEIRQALGKTSISKYSAMLDAACEDDRLRGMFRFYGANRTGRWAGHIVQLHNLPQNHVEDLDLARTLVADRDFEALELLYGEPAQIFSELVRTALIPSEGCRFVVSDFSAIEARVIAWLANEEWRLEVFRNGGDIYCASASRMFKVPVEKHGQNAHLRQRGKVAELALGYGGGVGAMKAMDKAGKIPEDELPQIVKQWRAASPNIVRLWRVFEAAAIRAVEERRSERSPVRVPVAGGAVKIEFYTAAVRDTRCLFVRLPSGRPICYWGATVNKAKESGDALEYWGLGKKNNKQTSTWMKLDTYGGKITENIIQATARDCLAEKMIQVTDIGYQIVAHVHDEMIVDVSTEDTEAAKTIDAAMAEPISWAPGLPLQGGTYECSYYKKD